MEIRLKYVCLEAFNPYACNVISKIVEPIYTTEIKKKTRNGEGDEEGTQS